MMGLQATLVTPSWPQKHSNARSLANAVIASVQPCDQTNLEPTHTANTTHLACRVLITALYWALVTSRTCYHG
jgi:hypothetical protein